MEGRRRAFEFSMGVSRYTGQVAVTRLCTHGKFVAPRLLVGIYALPV